MSETAGRTVFRRWRWTFFGRVIEYRSDLIAHDYMRRWVLRTPWFMLRVHHILRGDNERHFHDHPMDFVSLILRGGYVEFTPNNPPRICRPGAIVSHKAEDLHFLKLRGQSAWTFLITGQYRREWGFQTEDGWIPADAYDAYIARKKASGAPPRFPSGMKA